MFSRPAPVVRVGGPAGLVVGEVPRPRAAAPDQRLPAEEPGVGVGVLAGQRVGVHVTGGRELVVPVERREELLGLEQVDQLSVVHPPLQRRAEGGVDVAVHVVERPHAALGVGQLLAELHQVVGRLHLVGGDALGLEDVAAVVQHARDVEAGGEGRDAVQLVAPGTGPPRGGGNGREVGVLLDLVAGQVGRQVRELVAHQRADVHLGVPPGRQLDPVRQPLGGGHRRDDGVVVVPVRRLHLQLGAQRLAHGLVERVVRRRNGPPQRRDRGVLAALARHAGHRGDPVGGVAEEAGVREHVRATRHGGDVRLDRRVRHEGRQHGFESGLGTHSGLLDRATAASRQQRPHRDEPGSRDGGVQEASAVQLVAHWESILHRRSVEALKQMPGRVVTWVASDKPLTAETHA